MGIKKVVIDKNQLEESVLLSKLAIELVQGEFFNEMPKQMRFLLTIKDNEVELLPVLKINNKKEYRTFRREVDFPKFGKITIEFLIPKKTQRSKRREKNIAYLSFEKIPFKKT